MEGVVEGVVVRGRVQIDTRKPFRSVKEAVLMFGEKILAPEIYAKQINTQVQTKTTGEGQKQTRFGAVKAELEETKQDLQKAKEEGTLMAHCLQSLKEELEQTKREIQQLKARGHHNKQLVDPEIEELKFIEKAPPKPEDEEVELFERKRSVKFASPPALTRVIVTKDDHPGKISSPSQVKKKLKRRPLIPLIGALFTKKKGNQGN